MRIVGGRHRGRKLIGPSDRRIRPTSDRARQAGWATSPMAASSVGETMAVPAPSRTAPSAHQPKLVLGAMSAMAQTMASLARRF